MAVDRPSELKTMLLRMLLGYCIKTFKWNKIGKLNETKTKSILENKKPKRDDEG